MATKKDLMSYYGRSAYSIQLELAMRFYSEDVILGNDPKSSALAAIKAANIFVEALLGQEAPSKES